MVAIFSAIIYSISLSYLRRGIGSYFLEDFTLPFLFFFLYFFILSVEKMNIIYSFIAGVFLSISLLSWHFAQFFYLTFTVIICILFFLEDNKYFFAKYFGIIAIFAIISGILFTVLKESQFYSSISIILSSTLIITYIFCNYFKMRKAKIFFIFIMIFISSYILVILLKGTKNYETYGHVFSIYLQKIINLGQKPDNPAVIPFPAKALWVEMFNSPSMNFVFLNFFPMLILGIFSSLIILKDIFKKQVKISEKSIFLYFLFTKSTAFILLILLYSVKQYFNCTIFPYICMNPLYLLPLLQQDIVYNLILSVPILI